jgi:NAD(P)-dependent dehydrogenase (short-subunit alcohol dehydrogenase family)
MGISFTGRVAVVTGAGAGLGRSYARHLAARGAKVLVNDLGVSRDGSGADRRPAEEVAAEIRAAGGEAVANFDDVATAGGGRSIVESAVEAFGRLDVLIHNAGVIRDRTLLKMEEADWDVVGAVHLRGAYCVARPALARMKETGYGRIVFTSSISGTLGNFGQCNYAAAKMGLLGFANALKLEADRHDVKVNVIVPAAATRMTEGVFPEEDLRAMDVEQVTPVVLYLCSEACGDSGVCVNAFGGYVGRSAVVTGRGVLFGETPSPEDVGREWASILSLEGARTYGGADDFFREVVDRIRRAREA